MMDHEHYADDDIRRILMDVETIALVGPSPNSARPVTGLCRSFCQKATRSYRSTRDRRARKSSGRKYTPSLPTSQCRWIWSTSFVLRSISLAFVEEVIHMSPRPKVLWAQLGVKDHDAAPRESITAWK